LNTAVPTSTLKPKLLKSSRTRSSHLILQNPPVTTSTPVHVILSHSSSPDLEIKPLFSTPLPPLNPTTLEYNYIKPQTGAHSLSTFKPLKPSSFNLTHLPLPDSNLKPLLSTPFAPHSNYSNSAHFISVHSNSVNSNLAHSNVTRLKQKPQNAARFLPSSTLHESTSAHSSLPNSNLKPLPSTPSPSLFSTSLISNSLRLKPSGAQSLVFHPAYSSTNSSPVHDTSAHLISSNLLPLASTPAPVVFSKPRHFIRISPSMLSNLTILRSSVPVSSQLHKLKPLKPITLTYHHVTTAKTTTTTTPTTPAPVIVTSSTFSLPEISLKPLFFTHLPESTSTTGSDVLSTTRSPSSSLSLISTTSAFVNKENELNQNLNLSNKKVKSSSPNEIKKWQTSFVEDKNSNQTERVILKDKDEIKVLWVESEHDLSMNYNKSTIGAEVNNLQDFIRKGSQKLKMKEPQINRNINQDAPNQVKNNVLKQLSAQVSKKRLPFWCV